MGIRNWGEAEMAGRNGVDALVMMGNLAKNPKNDLAMPAPSGQSLPRAVQAFRT
jgi:hypothetical protein